MIDASDSEEEVRETNDDEPFVATRMLQRGDEEVYECFEEDDNA